MMDEDERDAYERKHFPKDARIRDDFEPLLQACAKKKGLNWDTLPIGNEARAHILFEVRQSIEYIEHLGGQVIC